MNEINKLFEFLKTKNIEKEKNLLSKVNNNENVYLSYDNFNNSLNNLLNLFVDDSEINYDIVNEYNEIKDTYLFNVKNIFNTENYDVFMSISNKYDNYSNILRKSFSNRIDADKYFNELTKLIKENNVKDLSSLLISMLK